MIVRTLRDLRATSGLATPTGWLYEALGASTSRSGVSVSADTALQYTAVYAAVRVLAETLASLPLLVYRRLDPRGKARAPDHPLYPVLHDLANPEMTSLELIEVMMGHLILRGNAFAGVVRDGAGRVRELWPLRPDYMQVQRVDGLLLYTWRPQTADPVSFIGGRGELLHVRGLSPDGIVGYSPIKLLREAIGLGLAGEEYGARFFANDASPRGVIQHPGKLEEPAHQRMKKGWESAHQGLQHAHKVAILEEGATWQAVGIAPDDAQWLAGRKFQRTEIASAFRVPPHKIGDLERATFSNIEHQAIEFVTDSMRPWAVRWEKAIKRDLLLPAERADYFAEFLMDGLLRGDTASRYAAYAQGVGNGWLSDNEVREFENLNPREGGDTYFVPLNWIPANQAGAGLRVARPPERRAEGDRVPGRVALRSTYARVFADATSRIFARERKAVMREARKHLLQRDAGAFLHWLEEFMAGDHRGFVERAIAPAVSAYAGAVAPGVAAELGVEIPSGPELERYLAELGESHAGRHVQSSLGQLRKALEERPEAELEALDERFDHFEQVRAERVGRRAGVQVGEAVAKLVLVGAGFRLMWRAFGDSCPFCTSMDGRTVSGGQSFAQGGATIEAPDRAPLTVSSNITTPPLHDGCDCSLVPG